MICNFCGAKISDGAQFCNHCGNKIEIKNEQKETVLENNTDKTVILDSSEHGNREEYHIEEDGFNKKVKLKSGIILIIILSLVLIVLIAIGIYLFTLRKTPDSNEVLSLLDYDSQIDAEDSGYKEVLDTDTKEEDVLDINEELTEETAEKIDDNTIHTYEIVTDDVTWQEAYADAIARGGYLVRINTYDEYRAIVDLLGDDYGKYHLYVGSDRPIDGMEYYWIDTDGAYFDTLVNEAGSWYDAIWYKNEPSFSDEDLDIAEDTLSLFKVSGKWWLNDTTNDFNANYGNQYSGLIGYIVEYE